MTKIQIEGRVGDRIPSTHVRTRLQRLLSRLPWEVVTARPSSVINTWPVDRLWAWLEGAR